MGIFNRQNLRKRTFQATIIDAEVIKDFQYPGRTDIPLQAAIKLAMKTSTGKETEQTWPIGDAKGFKVSSDGKTVTPRGDAAVSESSNGGALIAALDKLGVTLDSNVEPLEGLTFRWSQEAVPGKKGTTLLPVEQVGTTANEDKADEADEDDEESADEDSEEDESDDESADEDEKDDEEEEEDDEVQDTRRRARGEEPDVAALARKALLSVLKAKKKVGMGRVGIEVRKSVTLRGMSNKDAVAVARHAAGSTFLRDKQAPWEVKKDFVSLRK